MNACELGALRRLLMLSSSEAAKWVACDPVRPDGVEERTWNRWESGKVPVPANISNQILILVAWRGRQIKELGRNAEAMHAATGKPVAMVWYDEADDFPGQRIHWRPHCSTLASLLEMANRAELGAPVVLVPFDAGTFNRWRLGLDLVDDSDARTRWAEEWAAGQAHPLRAKDRAA